LVEGPIGAFDQNIREHAGNQRARRWFVKNCHVVDGGKGGEDFGAILLCHQWTFRALVAPHAAITIDGDNEDIAEGAGIRETSHMAWMQQIEAAVCEDDATPAALLPRGDLNEFILRNDLSH
jgi:hypothetical protein